MQEDLRSSKGLRFVDQSSKLLDTSQMSDNYPTRDTQLPQVVEAQETSDSKVPSGAVDLRDKYKEQILKKLDSKAIARRRERSQN
jgi:hypothetical protein